MYKPMDTVISNIRFSAVLYYTCFQHAGMHNAVICMHVCISQYVCLATLMLILVGNDDNRRQLIHYRLSLSCTAKYSWELQYKE